MKIICFVILAALFIIPLQAEKVAVLKELMKPDMITIGDERIMVSERAAVHIYSVKDFCLIKTFGKEGEGPQEFQITPFGPPAAAIPYKGKIYVTSFAKVSVFTNNGEFIKETKVAPFQFYRPFGDKFLFTGTTPGEKDQVFLSVNLANDKYEKIKVLYVSDVPMGQSFNMNFPMASFNFLPYKDKIYIVAGKEGFAIDVYDGNGTKLYRIKKKYKPLAVPGDYKKRTEDWFLRNPYYKQFWEFFKQRISFKSEYPPIRDMIVADDRIYVLTYKMKEGMTECIVMDLKGKEEKRVFVLAPELLGMDFYAKYEIYKREFYTLLENEDEEVWELHRMKLLD